MSYTLFECKLCGVRFDERKRGLRCPQCGDDYLVRMMRCVKVFFGSFFVFALVVVLISPTLGDVALHPEVYSLVQRVGAWVVSGLFIVGEVVVLWWVGREWKRLGTRRAKRNGR
jgi:DNA-directed RNA polymerase subunit RPC12/RpoP